MIKSALVYLVLALLAGLLLALDLPGLSPGLAPVYFHLFMVGWVTLLIFGVVYWMFPKYTMAKPRGNARLGWAVFGCINLGLALRVVGEALAPSGWGWLLAASAILQLLGGLGFVLNTWPRIKEK